MNGRVGDPATMTDEQPPFDPRRPFSRAQARTAGLSTKALLGPDYRKLLHDVHVSADTVITPPLWALAAISTAGPSAYASHHTAADLWGGCVPDDPDKHISVPDGAYRPRREGVRAHVAPPEPDVRIHRGVRVSSPVQCVLELSSKLTLVDLVVLADSLVAADVMTPEELRVAADRWTRAGARRVRRAAGFVVRGAESPMESRLRMLIVLAGLPVPTPQFELRGHDGAVRARLDLAFAAFKVAVEYEGRHHAESSRQWQRDIERREFLDEEAWRLLVVRADGIYVDPAGTLARVVEALRGRGASDVRIRSQEWRRHFPGRRAAA